MVGSPLAFFSRQDAFGVDFVFESIEEGLARVGGDLAGVVTGVGDVGAKAPAERPIVMV